MQCVGSRCRLNAANGPTTSANQRRAASLFLRFCRVEVETNSFTSCYGDDIGKRYLHRVMVCLLNVRRSVDYFPGAEDANLSCVILAIYQNLKRVRLPGVSHYADREPSNKKEKINRTLFARGDKAQQRRGAESTAAPPMASIKQGMFSHPANWLLDEGLRQRLHRAAFDPDMWCLSHQLDSSKGAACEILPSTGQL